MFFTSYPLSKKCQTFNNIHCEHLRLRVHTQQENKPFKRKKSGPTILEVQWSIQFPGSSISKPILTGHGSAPCPAEDGQNQGPGETFRKHLMVQATYLDDHIEGKGLAASWVMKPALNQAVVDVEKHPINSRFGSTWKELNSKNHRMSFFFGRFFFFWISTSCMGWLEGEIRGGPHKIPDWHAGCLFFSPDVETFDFLIVFSCNPLHICLGVWLYVQLSTRAGCTTNYIYIYTCILYIPLPP